MWVVVPVFCGVVSVVYHVWFLSSVGWCLLFTTSYPLVRGVSSVRVPSRQGCVQCSLSSVLRHMFNLMSEGW